MTDKHIFISHATADDAFVKELRIKLELLDIKVWIDSRNLRAGDQLAPEIEKAITEARQVIVVLSPQTINSAWVRKEVQMAEQLAKANEDYRVIPLMLPSIEPPALNMWFKEEPAGVKIQLEIGQLQEKIPEILAALGERLPDDIDTQTKVTTKDIAELLLELDDPKLIQQENGTFQLSSKAKLKYIPADATQDSVTSKAFIFTSPIGQIEQDNLRWYLEKYHLWPTGLFQKRANEIEAKLPQWGKAFYDEIMTKDACREVVTAWQQAKQEHDRRFSVRIDADLLEGSSEDEQNHALEAASKLISLPWELLHNGSRYLHEGSNPVRVRRRLPNYTHHQAVITQLPIRILLVSPRPEDEHTGYLDHRASAEPLVEAVEHLGDLVELTVLTSPTFAALENELKRAKENKQPYHVLHFDGHGVYDPRYGLGALCFEDAKDSHKLEQRAVQLVYAKSQEGNADSQKNIANLLHDYRIPLVFLEACQTAQSELDPNASVAASLLEEGVASVIAMSHSVLVKTAAIFVTAFYQELAQGQRVGQAMLAGQTALKQESYRFPILGAGELHMQDWFVPILYQEKHDPQLFDRIPSSKAERLSQQQQQARLGKLPATPEHSFIGRSRELLKLERLLEQQPYAVIRGQGGIGKTTIAVELARWLVRSSRFDRCAFVSLEEYSHDRAVLDELGRQLVGKHYTVAEYGDDLDKAMQPLQRVLENERCLLVLDNMESLLADSGNIESVLSMLDKLRSRSFGCEVTSKASTAEAATPALLFTTREDLPAPFNSKQRQVTLGELTKSDAKALVMRVMAEQGKELKHDDQGKTPEEVDTLVNAVKGHARALVLLAQELANQGLTATTENLQDIMQKLEREHKGERELSLFASVELSLQRLSAETRKLIEGLAVFNDGGNLRSIAYVLELEIEEAEQVCVTLIQIGLAEGRGYSYLHLDPALPNYLSWKLNFQQRQYYQQRWFEILALSVPSLHQELAKDIKLVSQVIKLELPNLMAFIQQLNRLMQEGEIDAEITVITSNYMEQMLVNLDYPQALLEVRRIGQQATKQLKGWGEVMFNQKKLEIDRLLFQGDAEHALHLAMKLLEKCEKAGSEAYIEAGQDLTMSQFLLGQTLKVNNPKEALNYLRLAQQGFETHEGLSSRMASISLDEQGKCLLELGKPEQAEKIYLEAIKRAEKQKDTRQLAIIKSNLSLVYLEKQDFTLALNLSQDSLKLSQQLEEPHSIATSWHYIGMIHRQQGDFDKAEFAFKSSISIRVTNKLLPDEAASLSELANLYVDCGQPEKAIEYYRNASKIHFKIGEKRQCCFLHLSLAIALIKAKQLDYARFELELGRKCSEFENMNISWKVWNMFYKLELLENNLQAADQARQKAIDAFLAYRRDGGENHEGAGRLALMVLQAIQQGDTAKIEQIIEQLLETWQSKAYLQQLQAIIAGDRTALFGSGESCHAPTEYDDMHYQHVVELKLLLEQLAA